MRTEDFELRKTIVEKRGDPEDPGTWPDIATLPGRLLPLLDLLGSKIDLARVLGAPFDRLILFRDAVVEAREALIALGQISPLEAWRLLHPPEANPLDGTYRCGNPYCPIGGFRSVEDKIQHYQRWGIPL